MFIDAKLIRSAPFFLAIIVSTSILEFPTQLRPPASTLQITSKHPITVTDDVTMVRLEAPDYFAPSSSIVHFSPNGNHFAIVLRKADLERDTSDSSLLLYQTAEAFHAPKPDILLRMSSTSNREAITKVRWLADSETLVFLGENPGEVSQICSFNIRSRRFKKLTNHLTAITNYDMTQDGQETVFVADPPEREVSLPQQNSKEIVVTNQHFVELVTGNYSQPRQIFWRAGEETPRHISVDRQYSFGWKVSISPNGRYVMFPASIGDIPTEWKNYADPILQQVLSSNPRKGTSTSVQQYLVFDSKNTSLAPVVDAPSAGSDKVSWSPDGNSIFISSSFLPLDTTDAAERKAREQDKYPIEVELPSKEYRKVGKEEFPGGNLQSIPPLEVTLDQDANTPPKIYVSDPKIHQKTLLIDLNPQFAELSFGTVKTIEWKVDGVDLIAGLYLPPDYVPGKRYPLVIQTHGFVPTEFSMDGRSEWGSAFAARPLASRGMLVLQFFHYKDHVQIDRVENDKSLGVTVGESVLHFQLDALQAVIDYLDGEGLIDLNRVGVSGFSRWACFIGYDLTHSNYRFAAASLVDGISCGYFEEVAVPEEGYDIDNLMGASPFGDGLKLWIKNSPTFNFDKVETPVQLAAFSRYSVVSAWEWYVGLTLQKKPVDFVYIPDAIHIGVKPSQRMSAQQRIVDWFNFWLQQEEGPDPVKRDQYPRWKALRK